MKTMTEMKALIAEKLSILRSNQAVASALAGTEFTCEGGRGTVQATLLPDLSPHGKIQARLTCLCAGCNETHDRERSDWHQSRFCRKHRPVAGYRSYGAAPSASPRVGYTVRQPTLNLEQQLEQAKTLLAKLEGEKAAAEAAHKAKFAPSPGFEKNAHLYES
jgi:hypothetical protein